MVLITIVEVAMSNRGEGGKGEGGTLQLTNGDKSRHAILRFLAYLAGY